MGNLCSVFRKLFSSSASNETIHVLPTEPKEIGNLFDTISDDMLLKIFSYQFIDDVIRNRKVCQRFEEIIYTNTKYFKKESKDVTIRALKDDQGKDSIEFCFSGFGCDLIFIHQNEELTVNHKRWGQNLVMKDSLPCDVAEGIQVTLGAVLRWTNLKTVIFEDGVRRIFTETEMRWISAAFKHFNIDNYLIITKNCQLYDAFMTFANNSDCGGIKLHSVTRGGKNLLKLNCPQISFFFIPSLGLLLKILAQWNEGTREIDYFQSFFGHSQVTWEPFMNIFNVIEKPETDVHLPVRNRDKLVIRRDVDQEEFVIIYDPDRLIGFEFICPSYVNL